MLFDRARTTWAWRRRCHDGSADEPAGGTFTPVPPPGRRRDRDGHVVAREVHLEMKLIAFQVILAWVIITAFGPGRARGVGSMTT